jgi:hypothetical protein
MKSIKKSTNSNLKTHIAIVKTLLDGSKKTQRQIAKDTDYKESTISKALAGLKKDNVVQILEGQKINKNYSSHQVWLSYEIDNGRYVIEFIRNVNSIKKFNTFISELFPSEKLIDMIIFQQDKIVEVIDSAHFRNMLCSSPSFFENFLVNTCFLEEFLKLSLEMNPLNPEFGCFDKQKTKVMLLRIPSDLYNGAILAFQHCVINDFLKSKYTHDAVAIMNENKKRMVEAAGESRLVALSPTGFGFIYI